MTWRPLRSTLFPYTTLFRSQGSVHRPKKPNSNAIRIAAVRSPNGSLQSLGQRSEQRRAGQRTRQTQWRQGSFPLALQQCLAERSRIFTDLVKETRQLSWASSTQTSFVPSRDFLMTTYFPL